MVDRPAMVSNTDFSPISMTPVPKRRWPRFSLRTLFVVVTVLACWIGWEIYKVVTTTNPNCYAVWWVADMAIDYMEANDGAWPKGWDDLLEPYNNCMRRSGRAWTFEELRNRVDVDWTANPSLQAAGQLNDESLPFKVIWLKDGSTVYWSDHEPNQMVLEYLRSRHIRDASPASSAAID